MHKELCTIIENKLAAPGHFWLKVKSSKIGLKALPGQFVQIFVSEKSYPSLPRPFGFLAAGPKEFSILYKVVGKGTEILSKAKKGHALKCFGPLGNGFSIPPSTIHNPPSLLLVGGGVGIPPLFHFVPSSLIKKSAGFSKIKIRVFLGARDAKLLLCESDFRKIGIPVSVATEDEKRAIKATSPNCSRNF